MKGRFLLATGILCSVLPAGCSRDELTTPDNQGAALAEETIGSKGGTVAADEIILTIPAGALAADQTLSIYESTAQHPFSQSSEPVFLLNGLPESLGAAVILKVYTGDAGKAGSTSMVNASDSGRDGSTTLFLGEERESQSRGRELTRYEVACQDSVGWCIASLDRGPYEMDNKAVPTLQVTPVKGLSRVMSSRNHFEITYHPEQATVSQKESVESATPRRTTSAGKDSDQASR
ncbi:MAG: hypothetical protein KJ970_08635 [Candidatus Eisenbacteria bacterium]|uniref:Uncharacterized protein n=1 Tax=Eiseniibacteriota bacterium TaxID=2212470 RepID=A0A948W3D9_UNCEI|nr:hypothetical protein [Candidatus Eisenbacteria bacterium]MBU1948672.1 hypothetical protein [Candidatus Eisenbacteria bacterium]MBU2690982.1 hypothetical protein [Candidatus Eisenbacteria bacterium]